MLSYKTIKKTPYQLGTYIALSNETPKPKSGESTKEGLVIFHRGHQDHQTAVIHPRFSFPLPSVHSPERSGLLCSYPHFIIIAQLHPLRSYTFIPHKQKEPEEVRVP